MIRIAEWVAIVFSPAGAILLAGLILSGCSDNKGHPAGPMDGQACRAALSGDGAKFETVADFTTNTGCGITDPVKLTGGVVGLSQPAEMSCSLALAVTEFEDGDIQALAQRYFHQKLTRLDHMGAYSCRTVRDAKGRMSEHAIGHAIDISGFLLADGTKIVVEKDWFSTGPKHDFLRAVAKAACERFAVVLTPNYNLDHFNHIHADLSKWKLCGI
jgi:hypothetical protein